MSGAAGAGGIFGVRSEDAGRLLETLDRVTTETRRARHGYWFPLLLSGLIILGNLPFSYWSLGHYGGSFNRFWGLCLCSADSNHPFGSTLYWLIAVPLGFVAVAAYYVTRARRTGLHVKIWPYVLTGLTLFALMILTATRVPKPLRFMYRIDNWRYYAHFNQGFMPVLVIALALFALAALERSRILWMITLVFFAVAILANTYNISNAFYRIHHWIVPDWAANLAVAGGSLVFFGVLSFIGLHARATRHATSG